MRSNCKRNCVNFLIGLSIFVLISYSASEFYSSDSQVKHKVAPRTEHDCSQNIGAKECEKWNEENAAKLFSLPTEQISEEQSFWLNEYLRVKKANERASSSGGEPRPWKASRHKRAAGQKSIPLAKRPRERGDMSAPTTLAPSSTTTRRAVSSSEQPKGPEKEEAEEEDEEQNLDDYQPTDEDKSATTTTTTTTTTTKKPPKTSPTSSGRKKAKSNKSATKATTTTTTTTTERVSTEEDEESSDSEGDEEAEEQQSGSKSIDETNKKLEKSQDSIGPKAEAPSIETSGKKENATSTDDTKSQHHLRRRPLFRLPIIKEKNHSVCISEAFLEFPPDLIGSKWRSRGLVVVHIMVVCYMFYSLALVCERYFMPSLEEFAQRLNLSEDVAGATLMSAGSSAPELFTALLGVFVAKGDVGTGAIVGSAVFNILFVIGLCAFVSTTTAQLQWWPVLRDSVYYTITVLVLILIIYDERITALESFSMIVLYGVYIVIMANNEKLKEATTKWLASNPLTARLLGSSVLSSLEGMQDDVFCNSNEAYGSLEQRGKTGNNKMELKERAKQTDVEEDSIYLAALLVIIKHKRLFRSTVRFQSAARYIIVKMQHRAKQRSRQQQAGKLDEMDYFEASGTGRDLERGAARGSQRAKMDAYALGGPMSKNKFSIVSRDDYEFWNVPPAEGENYYLWLAKIPVNFVLHYTIPDCALYPDKYVYTFVISIIWTAVFSYLMVWMVTLIGYTFGIPDSVMGVTFLAAGTSVPDCYSSIHAARNGMADMAVSNSIGSNVFDILIGLAVPWFIQSAIYPRFVSTINSRGIIYSVILLFLSLIVTIYLLNKYDWNLQPRLGLALLIAYGLFIVLTVMLEFDLFGHVNPPPCPVPPNS